MFRALLISFFLITSTILYLDRETDQGSSSSTTYSLASAEQTITAPRTVRTVAKPYANQHFTQQRNVADVQIEQKQEPQETAIQVAVIKPRIAPIQTAPLPQKRAIDPSNKHRIALLIKSELKQLGCFKGTISGSWETSARNALSHFNLTTAQNLDTNKPNLNSLTALKGYSGKACQGKYRVVQKLPSLELAHLPISKPHFIPKDDISSVLAATAVPAAIATAGLAKRTTKQKATARKEVIAQAQQDDQDSYKPVTRTQQQKTKKRTIRNFAQADDPDAFFNSFNAPRPYYAKQKKYRPAAFLVGRRKSSFARKRSARKATRNARRLRQIRARYHRMKRKKIATHRKFRRVRRRYRRHRKRFGFSSTGELGFW